MSSGKCQFQPAFGCREFPAFFRLVEEGEEGEELPPPQPIDMELGWMFYDVFDLSRMGTCLDKPAISVFRAQTAGGILEIPPYEDSAVHKVEEGGEL